MTRFRGAAAPLGGLQGVASIAVAFAFGFWRLSPAITTWELFRGLRPPREIVRLRRGRHSCCAVKRTSRGLWLASDFKCRQGGKRASVIESKPDVRKTDAAAVECAGPGSVAETRFARIVVMSDTHGFHEALTVPDGDILVHCGDAAVDTGWNRRHQFQKFASWFTSLPHPVKIFVAGNHDEGVATRVALGGCLLERSRRCGGLHFYGAPFRRDDGTYEPLPKDIDVLVSHVPPRGILDDASPDFDMPGSEEAIGSRMLRSRLTQLGERMPRLHLFGHVHEARGTYKTSGTLFVNAANANRGPAKYLEHGCVVLRVPLLGRKSSQDAHSARGVGTSYLHN
eukprot:CAMPEP_0117477560 /NCGR_PEP_ID=MMETSP0784-20121206/10888_1 /TAXON_ID=39447 /ORGANISM="" /LENGTH=339 /DNA_ID=CAMNT_0005271871 /DNA_START=20 /DNA_END=1039 /DNA_ORIENTATION=+